jgi:hypothetical protein
MLENIPLSKILFLDIETVPQYPDYQLMDERMKSLWDKKASSILKSENDDKAQITPASVYEKAGIYSEFGKIICISTGYFFDGCFRIKSFYGHDESELLYDFSVLINSHFNKSDNLLCAHNGKEFDFPFIARRMLINGIKIPSILNTCGKKPWEINHLDTMELWKFGDYKNYTSLELLTAVFNIPTPKDDIDGSQIRKVYYEDNDLKRIVTYCQKDTLAVAQLFLRYRGENILEESNVIYV